MTWFFRYCAEGHNKHRLQRLDKEKPSQTSNEKQDLKGAEMWRESEVLTITTALWFDTQNNQLIPHLARTKRGLIHKLRKTSCRNTPHGVSRKERGRRNKQERWNRKCKIILSKQLSDRSSEDSMIKAHSCTGSLVLIRKLVIFEFINIFDKEGRPTTPPRQSGPGLK